MKDVVLGRLYCKEISPKGQHLLDMQLKSYRDFLQEDVPPEARDRIGLEEAFQDIFPVVSANGKMELEYVSYVVGKPNATEENARKFDLTYSVPIKVKFRLKKYKNSDSPPTIFEKEINFCNIPYMTKSGGFIINGNDRVIINQMHRSPGVIFEEGEEHEVTKYGNQIFHARIIPYRGAWVEFEFDYDNALIVIIDRRKKFPATVLLRALGLETNEQIIEKFYALEKVNINELFERIKVFPVYLGKAMRISNEKVINAGTKLDENILKTAGSLGIDKLTVIKEESLKKNYAIVETLQKDNVQNQKQAILEFFRKLRIQEFTSESTAKEFFETLLFKTTRRYDLTIVGRYKINKRLGPVFQKYGLAIPPEKRRTLCYEDILATIYNVIELNHKVSTKVDDIDHLGNRRVRSVGELLQNQIKIGLTGMARVIKERMNMKQDTTNPQELINTAPVITAINKFFATSQLSQFLDQTSPLSELTHKRRISAIGPGGLNRKRAGFEVRDVHNSHYGKVCPIETPEGQNIGLLVSPGIYARVNRYGLLEAPYRRVENGYLTDHVDFLTADEEEKYVIAPATISVDENGKIKKQFIMARRGGDFAFVDSSEIEYVDLASNEILGPSASLIPFIEHDDANRALMGANMQRQAVPLLTTEAPVVSTGMEDVVARDSFSYIKALEDGEVVSVQADKIVIKNKEGKYDVYRIPKFLRTNQNTCLNYTVNVSVGQKVKKGMPLTTGSATDNGKLALGKNILVAFLSWEGYNYEDAVVISERLVKDDVFTSIHITRHETEVHIGSQGEMAEEITRDIPGVSPSQIANLDANGIIVEGTYVGPGDILVGKVAPEAETYVPHEVLLRSIFGEKGRKFKDMSLTVPNGVRGIVIGVDILERRSPRTKEARRKRVNAINEKYKKLLSELRAMRNYELKKAEQKLSEKKITSPQYKELVKKINEFYEFEIESMKDEKAQAIKEARAHVELPPGVYKKVRVFIATKRKIAIGDKIAGRHGNKGVVSIVLPVEDMPFLSDGTPVDMLLSPLSVPSRMNVGQILEAILGFAAKKQGIRYICPSFRSPGFDEDGIIGELKKAGLPESGTYTLYDGRTGNPLMEKVTVGYAYIMKLIHMAEDKIHARSTGHYSMVTRQPVGGKSLMGGQRFGEMEVWAIEGYGAAHLLREFLTVKSDDIKSRQKLLEKIIGQDEIKLEKGKEKEEEKKATFLQPTTPESFQVLVRELQSMGFKVELLKKKDKKLKK